MNWSKPDDVLTNKENDLGDVVVSASQDGATRLPPTQPPTPSPGFGKVMVEAYGDDGKLF